MLVEILSKIWDYVFLWFGKHDVDDLERLRKQIKWQSISVIFTSVIVGVALVLLFMFLKTGKIDPSTEWVVWIIIPLIVFSTWISCSYAYGVFMDWQPESGTNRISEETKEVLCNDVSFLQLKQCKNCSSYILSGSFIANRIEDLDSHSAFVKECKKLVNRSNIMALSCIIEFFTQASSCKLLCLLTNPQYYTPKKDPGQLDELIKYFVGFFPQKYEKTNKRIKRVFNLSAVEKSDDGEEKDRKKWLFQFVLTNVITEVETCLLDDSDDDSLKRINVDYVVGMEPDKMNNLFSLRKVFLSYEEKPRLSEVIKVEDQLLANLFESDFYDRVKGTKKQDSGIELDRKRVLIDIRYDSNNKNKFIKIKDFLDLSKEEIDECCNHVRTYIDNLTITTLNKEMKKELICRIDKVKKIYNKTK